MTARDLNEKTITPAVIDRMKRAKNKRFKEVMGSLVTHLHQFARDVKLTEAEWMEGIQFLTATGHKSDDKRQEFILLSDTLGLSTLVTQMNHRSEKKETEQTVFGPFHRLNAPRYKLGENISKGIKGTPCFVSGTVLDATGKPIKGVTVDVWHSDDIGFYDVQRPEWKGAHRMRGVFKPDPKGNFHLWTIKPRYYPVPTDGPVGKLLKASARHPMRPAHIHYLIMAPGYDPLVTHVFTHDDRYLDSDAVFGVRNALIRRFERHPAGSLAPDGTKLKKGWTSVHYDFVLRKLKAKKK